MTPGTPPPAPATGPPATTPESYAFVMNVWHLKGTASYALAPGHELRRATSEEIAVIKNFLNNHGPAPKMQYIHLWECQWPHPGGKIEFLPQEEWRYFVIAFRGSNSMLAGLESAFDLAPLELEVGFTVLYHEFGGQHGYGVAWQPGRTFHVLENAMFDKSFFADVSAADVDTVRAIHRQLQENDNRLLDVKPLATQLAQLKSLPHSSPLRFLGYFAVLESLLTHAPKPSDPYDSITRQVKKKLALLDHRWPRAVDYSPFAGAAPDTIWSKMYTYRSLVAHGAAPEFTGELAALGNHEAALKLIKETAKAVIRQALTEPQLLLDLREC
jgi:hypothetical protein